MKNTYLLFIPLLSLLLYSCAPNCIQGTGAVQSKTLEIANFSHIYLNDNVVVYITQGEAQKVEIKAHENIIPLLNTKVSGDEWEIKLEDCVASAQEVEIHVTTAGLDHIEVEGSGSLSSTNTLKGEVMSIQLNGSGDISLDLQVKELDTELNGSGDLQLKGSTKQHDIELDGSGDIVADGLSSDVVNIQVNGSGDVRVDVSYEINVDVNGSGDVYYKGEVKNIRSDINGSGNLHQLKAN